MALTFIIDGTSVTSGALLRRRLKFKMFAWMEPRSLMYSASVRSPS